MKGVLHILCALLVISLSRASVSAADKEDLDSRADSQIFKNTSSQPPPPIPPDSSNNDAIENVTSKAVEEVEIITKEATTIPLSTEIYILGSNASTGKSEKENKTRDEASVKGSDKFPDVREESTSTTESLPLVKVSVTSSVSSSADESNKFEDRKNGTSKVLRRPPSRSAQDKLVSSKPSRGNTILQRSGASGVCATPYGKMSVGQAIHWIGCRKIICRSERGFPHLLEKTCPPIPTNLPPGCTILHPSQTLPYPGCCPTPTCPTPGARSPPTLKPASAKTRSKQSQQKPKAISATTTTETSVEIENKRGKVVIYEADESSNKSNNSSSAQNEEENEIKSDVNSTDNESVSEAPGNSTKKSSSPTGREEKDFEELFSKPSRDHGQSRFRGGKDAKTLLDMLVGPKPSSATVKNSSAGEEKEKQFISTETNGTKRVNELLKNTAHHKNVKRKHNEHSDTNVPSTRGAEKLNETKKKLTTENGTDEALKVSDSKRYGEGTPWMLNPTDPNQSNEEESSEFPFEILNKANISESITIIKASFNPDYPKSLNDTKGSRKNSSSPIISAVSMTKVAIGDGYSNIEKSEHYEYSQETSISTPFVNANQSHSPKQFDSVGKSAEVTQNITKTPDQAAKLLTKTELSSTTVPTTTTVFSQVNHNFTVPKHQMSETTSVEVTKEKESESKNEINGKENNDGDGISQKVSIVETRPKYIKLFSLLKNAARNNTDSVKHKKLSLDTQAQNNLNKRDRITLAMVSEAIEKGLDALLNAPKKEKQPTTLTVSNNGTDDLIEFIYIGLNPPPQIGHRSNIRYSNVEEDMKSSETKQIERKRRNTKFHKHQDNEIVTGFRSRSRPVFYIPWRQRQNEAETKNIASEVPPEQKPSNISAQSSTIVESSTTQQAHTTPEIANTQENTSAKLEAGTTDQPAVSDHRQEDLKSQNKENKRDELAKRRSRSRMTIPGLRSSRNRANNGTKLNEKLTAFAQTTYSRYRKKNRDAEPVKDNEPGKENEPLKDNEPVKDKQKNAPEESKQESAPAPSRRRRLRGRRVINDAKDGKEEREALATETTPSKSDNGSQNGSRNRRMRAMRQRLLRRRKPIEKVKDQTETDEAVNAKERSETLTLTTDVTKPPEVMKKNNKVGKALSDAPIKDGGNKTTTLPILSVNSVTDDEASPKMSEKKEISTQPPKPVPRAKSLSARLRLKNRTALKSREPSSLPKNEKSLESSVLNILNHESTKKSLDHHPENSKDETKAVGVSSESDQTLNAIDNDQKVESLDDKVNNRQTSRRRHNLAQRERLLKLIRARARARQLTEPTTSAEITTQKTTSKTTTTLKPDVLTTSKPDFPTTLKPDIATTSIQLLVPKKVELKRIPVKIITEKPPLVPAQKRFQSIRQRLSPKPVGVIKPVQLKTPKMNLSPIRVNQAQPEVTSTTKAPAFTLATTSAANVVIPPRRAVQIAVRKHPVNSITNVSPQHIQNEVVTPKAALRGQKTYSPPTINQIVTQPQAAPIPVHQTFVSVQQPTHPPNQRIQLITRPPQTQRQNVYHTLNNLTPVQPNNQFIRHQNLQRTLVQNQQQHQPQLHRTQQNVVYHPSQPHPTNPPQHRNYVIHNQVLIPQTTTKKSVDYESLLPTIEDFPEMNDEYKIPSFDFGDDDFEYKEPQFVIDYKKKNEKTEEKPEKNKASSAQREPEFTIPKEPTFTIPKKSKIEKGNIPEGAKVTEDEYFIEGPSGVPIKVTTVTFHTSKTSVRNENVKNRSSHFKRDPFVE